MDNEKEQPSRGEKCFTCGSVLESTVRGGEVAGYHYTSSFLCINCNKPYGIKMEKRDE
jgi:hypothetical protein